MQPVEIIQIIQNMKNGPDWCDVCHQFQFVTPDGEHHCGEQFISKEVQDAALRLTTSLAKEMWGIVDNIKTNSEEPYFVEVDENGCSKCGSGRMWRVIGPGDIGLSTSYGLMEDAEDLAEELNIAYANGRKNVDYDPST